MSCLGCNCQNEVCFKEVCKNDEYYGFLCVQCAIKKNYCHRCDKVHDNVDFINNLCIYQLPGYISLKKKLDDLLAYLCNSQIIPNTLV